MLLKVKTGKISKNGCKLHTVCGVI